MGTTRLEGFSDGVLAIAITLLILDVHVPDQAAGGGLGRALAHNWPSYATYAISFVIIGIIWVNHHALFDQVARTTRTLLFLNLFLLMSVSFLPFPTALLSRYIRGGPNAHVAAAVYGADMTAIGLMFMAVLAYLVRTPEILGPGSRPATGARRCGAPSGGRSSTARRSSSPSGAPWPAWSSTPLWPSTSRCPGRRAGGDAVPGPVAAGVRRSRRARG